MKVLYALSFFVPVIRRIPCAFFVKGRQTGWRRRLLFHMNLNEAHGVKRSIFRTGKTVLKSFLLVTVWFRLLFFLRCRLDRLSLQRAKSKNKRSSFEYS